MRILVSGGGTAGHVAPILAVVDALLKQDSVAQLLYVGQADGIEARLAREAGIQFAAISAGKFRRLPGAGLLANARDIRAQASNIRDITHVSRGFFQAVGILRKFKPDVVFIKGGYVGLPIGWAARMLGIPYVIHESDITPGLANRLLAKHAQAIATGFPIAYYAHWPSGKLHFTGNPVRKSVLGASKAVGLKHFGLAGAKPVVLVLGGSQGARTINTAVLGAAPQLLEHFDVIHVAGENQYETVLAQASAARLDPRHFVLRPYLGDDYGLAFAAATMAVSRAGAGSISELAAHSMPTVLIPNATAAAHQQVNATVLERANAAVVLREKDLSPVALTEAIGSIAARSRHEQLSRAISAFYHPDAAKMLASLVIRSGEGR